MATTVMTPADIEAAISSIAQQKDDLRKSFEILKSVSPSTVSVTVQWKDIEVYLSSIENSIKERFRECKNLGSSSVAPKSAADPPVLKVEKKQDEEEVQPRPELKALCLNMDGKGLISFLTKNKEDIVLIRKELGPALLAAPDPVTLVLDSLGSFVHSEGTVLEELHLIGRSCSSVLECLRCLSLEIKPQARGRAREVAVKWKEMIKNIKEENNMILMLGFFHIIATFELIESFEDDDILDLIVKVGWRKEIDDLFKNSALEKKIPQTVKVALKGKTIENVPANVHEEQNAEKQTIPKSKRTRNRSVKAALKDKTIENVPANVHDEQNAGKQTKPKGNKTCHSCGQLGHLAVQCNSFKFACFLCGKKGHYQKQCPLLKAAIGAHPLGAPCPPLEDKDKGSVDAISQSEDLAPTIGNTDLVDKLISAGKHLIAVKVVISCNLSDKYPLPFLLQDYIERSKRQAKAIRRNGNNSLQSQNTSYGKELNELKALIKTVELYKLESVFPCEDLKKYMEELEKKKTVNKAKKQLVDAESPNPNKRRRHRRSTSNGPPVFPPHELQQNNLVLADMPPYNNFNAAPPFFIHGNPGSSANYAGPVPGYYGGAAMNGGYNPGWPAAYNPQPFNPSMYPWP